MGRARIISHTGDGLYQAQVVKSGRIMTGSAEKLLALEEKIAAAEELIDGLESDVRVEKAVLNSMLSSTASTDAIERQVAILRQAESKLQLEQSKLNLLLLEQAQIQAEIDEIIDEVDVSPVPIWCATHSTDLDGEVDTVEIDGDPRRMLLAPEGTAPVLPGKLLQTIMAQEPWQAFYNWAIYPGWQRWMPTYRAGTLTAIYESSPGSSQYVGKVVIDDVPSAAQRLGINPTDLADLEYEFSYLGCDHTAFQVGDRVLVAWPRRDFTRGVIVGFLSQPRPCEMQEHYVLQIGDIFSAWCPETEEVVLPPCRINSEAFFDYISRIVEDIEVEIPYTSETITPDDMLSGNPAGVDDYAIDWSWPTNVPPEVPRNCMDLTPTPMSDDLYVSWSHPSAPEYGCEFWAYKGTFTYPGDHKVCADTVALSDEPPGPGSVVGETCACYTNCAFYEWDGEDWVAQDEYWAEAIEASAIWIFAYKAIGPYAFQTGASPPWGEEVERTLQGNILLSNADGSVFLHTEIQTSYQRQEYTHCDERDEIYKQISGTWTFYGFGGQSYSGEISISRDWSDEPDTAAAETAVYDCPMLGGVWDAARTSDFICQFHCSEHVRYEEGTGPMQLFVSATSDYVPGAAEEVTCHDRVHNAAFAAFITQLWQAVRADKGVAANMPMNFYELDRVRYTVRCIATDLEE